MRESTLKDRQAMWALQWQQSGDEAALNRLIESCMGLVYQEAVKARRWSGLDREDLNSEGVIGIIRAAEKFDPEKGEFAACAYVWIRYHIQLYAKRHWSQFKVAHSEREFSLHQNIARLVAEGEAAGMTASEAIAAAAEKLRVDVPHAERALQLRSPARVISGSYDEDEQGVDPACDAPSAEEVCDDRRGRVRGLLVEAMSGLDDREKAILAARFVEDDTVSLDSLAERYGVTRERIRQVQNDALEYLRIELRSRGLALEDLVA